MTYVADANPLHEVGRLATAVVVAWWLVGCASAGGVGGGVAPSAVRRPMAPGAPALERVSPAEWPDLAGALSADRDGLIEALDRSLEWFGTPASHEYFPMGGITHARARASVYAFRELMMRVNDRRELAQALQEEFELYSSPGADGRGTVLYTGYYAPVFAASRTRTEEFRYPLYRLPDDLAADPVTGEGIGRRVGDRIVPYPTRAEIESSGMLSGNELVWLRDQFDAYLIHVQGSAALTLRDGSTMRVGYAGNNGHEYVSVGRLLEADGKLREDQLSLQQMRAYFKAHPDDLDRYLWRNDRFVFFSEEDDADWPAGSLGFKITPMRTLATDKSLFPAGGVVLVVTEAPDGRGGSRRFVQFMLDQDTGGAIRSPGRADIYFGIGPEAEVLAGGQYAEGRLYYLLLKPERVGGWRGRPDAWVAESSRLAAWTFDERPLN